MVKLRVINGRPHRTVYGRAPRNFRTWLEVGGPVLLGTFHRRGVGPARLPDRGLWAAAIYVVRQRVGKFPRTSTRLAERFGRPLICLVNEPEEMLFALKGAAATTAAIAMTCDRDRVCARTEEFGISRSAAGGSPFTIIIWR